MLSAVAEVLGYYFSSAGIRAPRNYCSSRAVLSMEYGAIIKRYSYACLMTLFTEFTTLVQYLVEASQSRRSKRRTQRCSGIVARLGPIAIEKPSLKSESEKLKRDQS